MSAKKSINKNKGLCKTEKLVRRNTLLLIHETNSKKLNG